jgi:hypothetical protein
MSGEATARLFNFRCAQGSRPATDDITTRVVNNAALKWISNYST